MDASAPRASRRNRRAISVALAAWVAALAACGGREEAADSVVADSIPEGELVLPPSAGAARAPQPGGVVDTLVPGAPDDSLAPEGTVGNVPADVLDVSAIASTYRRFYANLFAEVGSPVRGNVDPELVEEAKRRTALEFGFVDVNAWNSMLAELSAGARADLAGRIAVANRGLSRELHGAQGPPAE